MNMPMPRGHEIDSAADKAEMARYAEKGRQFLAGRGPRSAAPTPTDYEDPAIESMREAVDRISREAMPRQILTVHPRYGQPPGELAYTSHVDWTPEQQRTAAAWLANEQAKDWWRGQAAAQRALAS